MKRGLIMNRLDNVVTVLDDIEKDEIVSCKGLPDIIELKAGEKVPRGHKMALSAIPAGAAVVKYGFEIGYSLCAITKGSYVHVHNVGSKRTEE